MNTHCSLDLCLLAHGEILKLVGPVILVVVLIVGSIVNSAIALPIAGLVGWRLFRSWRKRWKFAQGLAVFLAIFLGLWVLEAVVFFMNVDISNRPKPNPSPPGQSLPREEVPGPVSKQAPVPRQE